MDYSRIRTAADVEQRIKGSIAYYDTRINAWKAVKRLTKKDGSDFANFGKNFENARIYAPYGLHNKLVINFRDENGRYTENYIELAESVSEQFEQINETIGRYQRWKEEAEKDLENAFALAEFTLTKIREIKAEFEKSGCSFDGDLYFSIGALLENSKYFERI